MVLLTWWRFNVISGQIPFTTINTMYLWADAVIHQCCWWIRDHILWSTICRNNFIISYLFDCTWRHQYFPDTCILHAGNINIMHYIIHERINSLYIKYIVTSIWTYFDHSAVQLNPFQYSLVWRNISVFSTVLQLPCAKSHLLESVTILYLLHWAVNQCSE